MRLLNKRCNLESKCDQNQNSATVSNHQNLSMLINKRDKLYHYITSVNPNVMCITKVLPQKTLIPVAECKF